MYLQLHVFIFCYILLNPYIDGFMFMNVVSFVNMGSPTITILARLTCQRGRGIFLFLAGQELDYKLDHAMGIGG